MKDIEKEREREKVSEIMTEKRKKYDTKRERDIYAVRGEKREGERDRGRERKR